MQCDNHEQQNLCIFGQYVFKVKMRLADSRAKRKVRSSLHNVSGKQGPTELKASQQHHQTGSWRRLDSCSSPAPGLYY